MRGVCETGWFASAILLGLVILPGLSHAAVIFEQPLSTATTTNATHAFFKLPGGISALYGLESIALIASANAMGHAFEAVVICRVNANYTGNCPEMPDFSIRTGSQPVTKTPTQYILHFGSGSTTPLVSSRYYAFGILRSGGDVAGIDLRGVTTTNTCIIAGCGLSGSPFVILTAKDEEREIDPVIIIPGILGSEKNSDGVWVIDPILHTYDDLIATLDANHYTPEIDLFSFPYNWRKSNVETAVLLKEKIDEVKTICNCGKVDLVAHSMGGLVARQYIQSSAYEDDVNQLIFLGTPHLGAPKAYLMWEGGAVDPEGIENFVLWQILNQEARESGYSDLYTYLRTQPIEAVRQLLPVYDYIFSDSLLREYPMNYPTNPFLEVLNGGVESLLNSDVEIHNFVGSLDNSATITGISVINSTEFLPLWIHGYPLGFNEGSGSLGLERGSGDATVPLASASFLQENLTLSAFQHNELPDDLKPNIFQILTGEDADTLVDNNKIANFKLLLIKIFSPADLLIIAPDGKKIGKENGESVNEIPGAFYTGFNTDTEFITILNPVDGDYTIVTHGTGSGEYTVETNYISDATTTTASFTGITSPAAVIELVLEVDNANPGALNIIPPDLEAPTITINSPTSKDYVRSEVLPIEISATDPESEVASLDVHLDGEVIPSQGIVDLFYYSLGNHTIHATSSDVLGNGTTTSRIFRIVANATSTRADIERTYTLGWTSKKTRDQLIKKLSSCYVNKSTVTNVTKVITTIGPNGKPVTKTVTEKVTKVDRVFDKNCAKAMLKEVDKYRGKGLNEQAHQLIKENIQWLINN